MSTTKHSSRDEEPAYLLRYESRKKATRSFETIDDEPDFVARARQRSIERALDQIGRADGPPGGRTIEFARETVSPRELQYPETWRERVMATTDVRLIRHGQTQGYITDGGLTPLGKWQAHRKGQDLAKGAKQGDTIRFLYAATARAFETAVGVREGVNQALARFGIVGVDVAEPVVAPAFDNFQVSCNGREMDVTSAFQEFARILDDANVSGVGSRAGWLVEMDRFFRIQHAGGDPITSWLTTPMTYFEPPVLVVRRWWQGVVDAVTDGPDSQKVFVCSHSGPIRAFAAQAVGHDPGEPNNLEDVRIRINHDLERATVTYRGRGLDMEVPVHDRPSWYR